MSIDITRPLALMCAFFGLALFLYGNFFSAWMHFGIPHGVVPLKLNQSVGAFFILFALVVWQFGRFSHIKLLHAELKKREKELKIENTEKEKFEVKSDKNTVEDQGNQS